MQWTFLRIIRMNKVQMRHKFQTISTVILAKDRTLTFSIFLTLDLIMNSLRTIIFVGNHAFKFDSKRQTKPSKAATDSKQLTTFYLFFLRSNILIGVSQNVPIRILFLIFFFSNSILPSLLINNNASLCNFVLYILREFNLSLCIHKN